ncbi:MAG: hypothetical protein MJ195_01765 [Mycoplasmoidaceae bacterium]|nr:hypothetical protein [Mycoplasmoidaceae bacterium]
MPPLSIYLKSPAKPNSSCCLSSVAKIEYDVETAGFVLDDAITVIETGSSVTGNESGA